MKHILHALLIPVCIMALVGCKGEPDSSPEETPVPPVDSFEIIGTVAYKNLEGGFYAIDGDDGKKYNPINLPEPFREDGLKVKVTARKQDAMSAHMYGGIIEVVDVEAR